MLTYSSHRGARFSALCNLLLASFIFVTFVAPRTALGQLPIGQWTFDQAQGTQETDVSSHGHTASLMNGVSRVGTPVGEGVAADASTRQYIRIPPIDLTQTKGATVTLWVNRLYSTSGTTTLLEASEDYRRSATGFTVSPDDNVCRGLLLSLRGDTGYTSNCYNQPSSGVWH